MGSVLIGIDTNSPQELGLQYPGHVPCKLIFSAKDGTHMKAIILGSRTIGDVAAAIASRRGRPGFLVAPSGDHLIPMNDLISSIETDVEGWVNLLVADEMPVR